MDLYLRFEFDTNICKGFRIKNPPTVPCEGEIVDFVWEDFVEDPEDLARVKEFCENGCFMANILSRDYAKDHAEVLIILMNEENYYKHIIDMGDYPERYLETARRSRKAFGPQRPL